MSVPFGSIETVMASALEVLAPPPEMTVSQWADKHRRLSSEASASPGQWRTDVVEYAREIMDCVGDPAIRRLTVQACAQVAKTEILLNILGYYVDYDPSPTMVVQPTLDMAKTFSKDRLSPMLRDTPRLKGKVKDVRSRDSGNTILQKSFLGGHITMVGANSAPSLASRPIRVILCDEVDRFPESAGTEGDPIQLAVKRSVSFWNRVLVFVSTPTNKGSSRIELEYEQGDMRQYWVPCPHCGEHQVLEWHGVRWSEGQPDSAYYECQRNGCVITNTQRIIAVRKGQWRAQKEFKGNASFHISGMMSPFVSLAEGVREFLSSKSNPQLLKVWVNTYLGETWEDQGSRLEHTDLMEQREDYGSGEIPPGVTILTAGVDVQDDRIELEVVGWGDDNESWSIDYKQIYGDPSAPEVWEELRAALRAVYVHPYFGELTIRGTGLDTGHYAKNAYRFSLSMPRVFALKGVGGENRPSVGRPSRNNIGKVQLFGIGTDTLKETMFARLRVREPGTAGYCHFPSDREEPYFLGLTAEKLVTRFHRGFKKTEYVKTRPRNEPVDLRCYAIAALEIIAVDVNAQRRALMRDALRVKPAETDAAREEPYLPSKRPAKRGNWATGWKNG